MFLPLYCSSNFCSKKADFRFLSSLRPLSLHIWGMMVYLQLVLWQIQENCRSSVCIAFPCYKNGSDAFQAVWVGELKLEAMTEKRKFCSREGIERCRHREGTCGHREGKRGWDELGNSIWHKYTTRCKMASRTLGYGIGSSARCSVMT